MSDWRTELGELAGALGWHAREAARRVRRALDSEPYHVVSYRGYATTERALVLGRVLQDEGIAPADAAHSRWHNLTASLRRIECDPLPFARVRARVGSATRDLVADDEGFVRDWVGSTRPLDGGWNGVTLELSGSSGSEPD